MRNLKQQSGYTLIEMLVAITLSTLLILTIGGFATNSVVGANQDYNRTLVLANAKEAVGIVARQIRLARSVMVNNTIADTHAPSAPGNLYSWSGAVGSGSALVLAVPSRKSDGSVIYIDGNNSSAYTDNVIFYLDSTTKRLYKRTLANPAAAALGGTAVTTCPPPSASPTCPADSDVVDDVANLTTSYIRGDGTTTLTPANTEAVNFTVTETRTISGKSYSGTYTTIATLRNR
jgi:prepilin-type N-terminal cleavage/methylation domain-containing protein